MRNEETVQVGNRYRWGAGVKDDSTEAVDMKTGEGQEGMKRWRAELVLTFLSEEREACVESGAD